jgi:hypothetical protein
MDPSEAFAEFLRVSGIRTMVTWKSSLPGVPCETCAATQVVPSYVAKQVLGIANQLGCSLSDAFLWASRLGAIVLANPASAGASTPMDALSSVVMGEYVARRQILRCALADRPA